MSSQCRLEGEETDTNYRDPAVRKGALPCCVCFVFLGCIISQWFVVLTVFAASSHIEYDAFRFVSSLYPIPTYPFDLAVRIILGLPAATLATHSVRCASMTVPLPWGGGGGAETFCHGGPKPFAATVGVHVSGMCLLAYLLHGAEYFLRS
jgi:hypothetical protein